MGDVTRLRHRTAGDRKAIHTYIMRGWAFDAGSVRGGPWDGEHNHLGLLPLMWRHRLVRESPAYVVWGFRTPVAWYVPERTRWEYDPDLDHQVMCTDKPYWVVPGIQYTNRQVERAKRIAQVALSLARPRIRLDD